ncbi:ankyrin repeat domain-containing protein 37 [Spea bombifrons]|uniref:ankyrin repeat domain-containing protein 37 n=1 Tax=Spea bombifrons TaxID=233779 RepID=UPI00234985D6|nr:ankyrin repeat domain-containing protein 37 [Spea bombifrons]
MLQQCNAEWDCLSQLMESGCAVNSPADTLGQSPAHLAASGGEAFFLLWQLQTGVDINQQDCFGEAPIHKAARSGSLECLSLLVARDARLDTCNKDGYTPEDLAASCGFLECAKYLATVKHTQNAFLRAQSSSHEMRETTAAIKRGHLPLSVAYGKRRRSDGFI